MLEVLFPNTRRKLLILFFSNPDDSYHLREIIRTLDCGKGAVERELVKLVSIGLIRTYRKGNLSIYCADRSSPIFPEIYSLVMKTEGIADTVRAALELIEGVEIAFIFGSAASGRLDRFSDVDVLVVGSMPFGDVSAALAQVQLQLGRDIAPTVYSPHEFQQRLRDGHHFLSGVLKGPKIILIGDENGIAGMDFQSPG